MKKTFSSPYLNIFVFGETGELAEWLGAFAALVEDPGSVPRSQGISPIPVTPTPDDPMPSSDL